MYAKVVNLQIIAYFGRMKNYKILFLLSALVIGVSSVALSKDVDKVPKSDISFVADNYALSGVDLIVIEEQNIYAAALSIVPFELGKVKIVVTGYDLVAILPPVPDRMEKDYDRICYNSKNYHEPDIDRKWVWFYSVITNS